MEREGHKESMHIRCRRAIRWLDSERKIEWVNRWIERREREVTF
jgi:hypothetical protein